MEVLKSSVVRHPFRALALLAAVKCLVLLTAHLALGWQPFQGDNAKSHYVPVGYRMVTEGRFNGPDSRPDSKVGPGYPLLLAGAIQVAGGRFPILIVLLQVWGDCLTAAALFYLLAPRFSRGAALAAGLLWQLFPPEVIMSTWIAPETLFTTMMTVAVVLLTRHAGIRAALASGVLLGLSAYLRSTSLPVLAALAAALLLLGRYRQAIALCAAGFAIVAPWVVRNQVVLDDPILMSVGFGSVLQQGSDARYFWGDGKKSGYPPLYAAATLAGIPKPLSPKESVIDSWKGRVGLYVYRERWRTAPGSYVPFALHKMARLWYGMESGNWRAQLVLGLFSLLVAPLAFFELWSWRHRARPEFAVLGAVLVLFVVLHLVTLPEFRYLLPVFPLLIASVAAHLDRHGWFYTPSQPGSGRQSATLKASV